MLLLEVLIAFALVALCILPIIAPQLAIVKEQKAFVRYMEIDHASHKLFVDVLEKLYTNRIDWGSIESKSPHIIPENMLPKGFEGAYFLELIDKKHDGATRNGPAKEWIVYKVQITFTFTEKGQEKNRNEKLAKRSLSFPYKITLLKHLNSNGQASSQSGTPPSQPPTPSQGQNPSGGNNSGPNKVQPNPGKKVK